MIEVASGGEPHFQANAKIWPLVASPLHPHCYPLMFDGYILVKHLV